MYYIVNKTSINLLSCVVFRMFYTGNLSENKTNASLID